MSEPPAVRTLLERLAWRAANEPEREAFVFQGRVETWGELWSDVERCAGGLLESGLERGERNVIALPNGADFFVAFYGTLAAGGIAVPVYSGVGPRHLADVARRCGATLVTAPDPLTREVGAVGGLEETALSVADLLERHDRRGELAMPAPGDIAYIQYTSGSTGEPKGVQVTHANVLVNIEQMIAGMEITPRDVFVSWLPVCHDMGLVLMTMVPFYLGARLSLLPASLREIRPWLREIGDKKGTFTAAPDFAYRLCLRHIRDPREYDLSSLRVALNAAEPVRKGTLRGFESAFELERVMAPGYGLAESTVGVSMWPPGVAAKFDERGFPSVGRGFPGVEIEVLAETGPAPVGEIGEILVKSAANTPGYFGDQDSTRALFDRGEFLCTGDLGYVDRDGDLFVLGRKKNIIIQAGRNIAPKEVEDVLDRLPFVRLSAAVGVDRGGDAGEQIYAFVELRGGHGSERNELRRMSIEANRAIRSHLGLAPGRIYLTKPKTVPFTKNGKIRHAELCRLYEDGALRRQGKLIFPGY